MMAAGYEVRNHSNKPAPNQAEPECMITIQVLAADDWTSIDFTNAQRALTAAYGSAMAELVKRCES